MSWQTLYAAMLPVTPIRIFFDLRRLTAARVNKGLVKLKKLAESQVATLGERILSVSFRLTNQH